MDQALLVFGKVPRPGTVKTRLTPHLPPSDAARLYSAFLRDTLRQGIQLKADVCLYLAPPLPENGLDAVPPEVSVREQRGANLGARMKEAIQSMLAQGYERVVVMGSDHPTLPLSFLKQAFGALREDRSICIGPTDDGGFYLLGMTALFPQLFERMSYSHSQVFSDTLARVEQTEASLTVLPQWYDVDTPSDLNRLCSELEEGEKEILNTRAVLTELGVETLL